MKNNRESLCSICNNWKLCSFPKLCISDIATKNDFQNFIQTIGLYDYVKDYDVVIIDDRLHVVATECDKFEYGGENE